MFSILMKIYKILIHLETIVSNEITISKFQGGLLEVIHFSLLPVLQNALVGSSHAWQHTSAHQPLVDITCITPSPSSHALRPANSLVLPPRMNVIHEDYLFSRCYFQSRATLQVPRVCLCDVGHLHFSVVHHDTTLDRRIQNNGRQKRRQRHTLFFIQDYIRYFVLLQPLLKNTKSASAKLHRGVGILKSFIFADVIFC